MNTSSLTNHFLIAMPSLEDSYFTHTVTYICDHGEDGAMGIIINIPMSLSLHDLFRHMEGAAMDEDRPQWHEIPVFSGGPVQQERGFVLHSPEREWTSTLEISPEVSLTTSRDILMDMAHDNGPIKSLVALGYAGWAAGQLEQELAENTWLSVPASSQIIFDIPYSDRWQAAAKLLGVDMNLLSPDAGHA